MSDSILVTYASHSNTTAGIAEFMGDTLRDQGLQVDVLPVQQVKDLSPYSAVVMGSAIHAKAWLPEAMQFVRTHQTELKQKPFAAFLVCMTLALANEEWRERADVSNWLSPVRALVKPVSEGFFAGALDISKVPSFSDRMKFRISVMTGVWSEGDHRDWNAIHQWASELPERLGVCQSE